MNIVGRVHIKHHYFPVILGSSQNSQKNCSLTLLATYFWELELHYFETFEKFETRKRTQERNKGRNWRTDRFFLKFCWEQIIENTFLVSKFKMITKYFPFLFPKMGTGKLRSLAHILLFHYTEQSIIEKWQWSNQMESPRKVKQMFNTGRSRETSLKYVITLCNFTNVEMLLQT